MNESFFFLIYGLLFNVFDLVLTKMWFFSLMALFARCNFDILKVHIFKQRFIEFTFTHVKSFTVGCTSNFSGIKTPISRLEFEFDRLIVCTWYLFVILSKLKKHLHS